MPGLPGMGELLKALPEMKTKMAETTDGLDRIEKLLQQLVDIERERLQLAHEQLGHGKKRVG